MKHEMQHTDGPTWCKWCGTFDVYCRDDDECGREEKPQYDFDDADNFARQFRAMFPVKEAS